MSHISTIKVEIGNEVALKRACERLGGTYLGKTVQRFYDNSLAGGLTVQLKGWEYPIVFTKNDGVKYDNYEGAWGNIADLDKLQQYYALESAKMVAEEQEYSYHEETLSNGTIKLIIDC